MSYDVKKLIVVSVVTLLYALIFLNKYSLVAISISILGWLDFLVVRKAIERLSMKRFVGSTRLFVDEQTDLFFELKNPSMITLNLKFIPTFEMIRISDPKEIDVTLKPHGIWKNSIKISFGSRGKKRIGESLITVRGFFDLFGITKSFDFKEDILVFPKMIPASFEKEVLKEILPGRRTSHKMLEDTSYLKDIREYNGQPMNRIHWKLSAKYNDLFVKEFENTSLGKVRIFLDLNLPWSIFSRRVWSDLRKYYEENSISAVATIIKELKERNTPVELTVIGKKVWKKEIHGRDWVSYHEMLAQVSGTDSPEIDTSSVLEKISEEVNLNETVILVCIHITDDELPVLLKLRARSSKVIVFVIPYGFRDPSSKPFRSYITFHQDLLKLLKKVRVLEENHVVIRVVGENMTFQEVVESVP